MSQVQVDKIYDKDGSGAPQLPLGAEVLVGYGITGAGGINISGVATASSFSGNITGDATGLSGTPDITVNNVTAGVGTFSGFVAFSTSISVGGTITYEDVTNVDSVGFATFRQGVNITGVCTASSYVGSGANLTGLPAGFTELDAMLFN